MAGPASQDQDDAQSQAGSDGCGESRVVALGRTGGDQGVSTSRQGLGARPLQLAHLVAAAARPEQVIALDPQVPRREVESSAQTVSSLDGRADRAKVQVGGTHPPVLAVQRERNVLGEQLCRACTLHVGPARQVPGRLPASAGVVVSCSTLVTNGEVIARTRAP